MRESFLLLSVPAALCQSVSLDRNGQTIEVVQ